MDGRRQFQTTTERLETTVFQQHWYCGRLDDDDEGDDDQYVLIGVVIQGKEVDKMVCS